MSWQRSELNELLLGLLAQQAGAREKSASLSPADLERMLSMAMQHRLGPLLHWRLREDVAGPPLPQALAERLAASDRLYALRSLQIQHALLHTQRILRQASIVTVFLKGAFLAWHVYPRPALRPLRDLDILVPRSRAAAAFEALLQAGFELGTPQRGSAAEAAGHLKHLPALTAPPHRVLIELHTRLISPEGAITRSRWDLADDPQLWARLIFRQMNGERIAFLSPTDQLLHLIIHAVFDHGFNNGPLVLADVIFLLQRFEIDWPKLWQMAAAGGWIRGVWLLLQVARHFYPPLRFEAPAACAPPPLSEVELALASTLMLGTAELSQDVRLSADLVHARSSVGRGRVLLQRLCPSRHTIAAFHPGAEHPLGLARAYLAHWWRLGTVRLPRYLAARSKAQLNEEAASLAALKRWLTS